MTQVPAELGQQIADTAEICNRCSNRVLVTLRRMQAAWGTPAYLGLVVGLGEAVAEFGDVSGKQASLFIEALDLFSKEPQSQ